MATPLTGSTPAAVPSPSSTRDRNPTVLESILRRLAASVAHNINNALTGVFGYTQLALQETPPGSSVHDHLQDSLHCASKVAETIRGMTAYAFRPDGHMTPALLSLRETAEQTASRFRDKLHTSRIHVIVQVKPACWVQANASLLHLVLDQIMNNALEAMPEGGTVCLRVWGDGSHCRLSVSDTGPGLPAEVQARLFEPFFTTKCSGHLGLGLALCRDLIALQDGAIEVTSVPGQGTTATLSFPAGDAAPFEEDLEPNCVAFPVQGPPDESAKPSPSGPTTAPGRMASQLHSAL